MDEKKQLGEQGDRMFNDDLDYVFEKLMVSQNKKCCTSITKPAKLTKRVEEEIGKKLANKKPTKRDKRLLLKKPKLLLVKKSKDNITDDFDEEIDSEETEVKCDTINKIQLSCSTQFFNQTFNNEDSSPDELASYFEQILYIPKPMSHMAEMMYA